MEPMPDLRMTDVPIGWSNHPELLREEAYFTNHRVNESLHPSQYFSNPQPILTDTQSHYIFEEEERGIYYVWNDISSYVFKIEEDSLANIRKKLSNGGLFSMNLTQLRTIDGPSGEPTSNVPYLPNPDYVDRPDPTEKLRLPPQRSVLLYGSGGCGKSELAVQYASKTRALSQDTWVFWLYATTNFKFEEDLVAIADILPGGWSTRQELSQKEFVLEWLCTEDSQRWLLVIDDIKFNQIDTLSTIDRIWNANPEGSFLFTSTKDLHDLTQSCFTSSVLKIEVEWLHENEGLQLLHKKLEREVADADCQKLVTGTKWTPLAMDLAATALNKRLTSMPKLIKDTTLRYKDPLAVAFDTLFKSLDPYERHLLSFIHFFEPPEVPRHWIRSYSRSQDDDEGQAKWENSMQSLIESSLLAKIPDTNTYRIHRQVQSSVSRVLTRGMEYTRRHRDARSFLDWHNFIPKERIIEEPKPGIGEKILTMIGDALGFVCSGRVFCWSRKNERLSGT